MSRVALHTLGCKLNFAETATIAGQFRQRGFQIVGLDESPDVVVLNTCSVTERADRECRQVVRRALRHSPDAYVIVLGCYAQLQPNSLASIPGVDLVLGTKEKFQVFSHADWTKTGRARTIVAPIDQVEAFHHASSVGFAERTRGFLKIQDGCDFHCSFCTIPLARGASRSVGVDEILAAAWDLTAQGFREIVLTGVNVGDYGKRARSSLLALLRELEQVSGVERIRVSSIEPNLLSDELIEFWIGSKKLCNHFHIPLQSGSDPVLHGMRRRYQKSWYAGRLERIKTLCPDAGIGSDVIVGFPGETDEHFEETYRFLVDQPVSYLHVFTYSERPRTAAAEFDHKVEPKIRAERSERLRILSAKKRRAFSEGFMGKPVVVLFETPSGAWETGLSGEYVRVMVQSPTPLENQIRTVTLESHDGDACIGSLKHERPPVRPGRIAAA